MRKAADSLGEFEQLVLTGVLLLGEHAYGMAMHAKIIEQYFGQRPDEYQRARFFLMRQVVHMFSAAVFLLLGSAGKPISQSENLPSFRDFHRRIWAGEVNLADNDLKILYGMVHWEQLLQNMRRTRFDEALGIVSKRNTSQEGVRLLLPSAP